MRFKLQLLVPTNLMSAKTMYQHTDCINFHCKLLNDFINYWIVYAARGMYYSLNFNYASCSIILFPRALFAFRVDMIKVGQSWTICTAFWRTFCLYNFIKMNRTHCLLYILNWWFGPVPVCSLIILLNQTMLAYCTVYWLS